MHQPPLSQENPWYSFLEAELTPGHMVLSVAMEKKSPVTPPGIDPETIWLVAQCPNHYATPDPRNLFQSLQILPLTSQYLLSLLMFVVQNKNLFSTNIENHNIDTTQRNNLYLPQANLTIYQKGSYYLEIKIFNNLYLEIKNVAGNQKKFKIPLKQFLYTHSFYTLEKYFNQSRIMYCIIKFLIILVLVLRCSLRTLYKYSLIVYYDLISFPCINLMCLIYVLYS